jgi:hypothetical protein
VLAAAAVVTIGRTLFEAAAASGSLVDAVRRDVDGPGSAGSVA